MAVERFKKLIDSYERKGYDNHSEIELGRDLHLIDGSHRMALAMYHRCPTINARVRNYSLDVYYSLEWFAANDFSKEECELMKRRYEELSLEYYQPFVCTIWHPAHTYFDEIERKLSLFGKLGESKDLTMTANEYRYYTRGIYAVDDIEKWKIEKKILHMVTRDEHEYHLRLVTLSLTEPGFRLKYSTNGTLSKKCELIKKIIRTAYKCRVKNYCHDIVMHIGDNFYQNQYIYNLLNMPKLDFSSILSAVSQLEYVITKMEVDYMPEDFPKNYPLGKDIDIVCCDNDNFEKMINTIWQEVQIYNQFFDIRKILMGSSRCQIRIELNGYVVFIFDIFYKIDCSKDGIAQELCKHRVYKNGYYIPDVHRELLVRLCEVKMHPKKKHHLQYVLRHKDDIDQELCDQYLNFNWKRYVN